MQISKPAFSSSLNQLVGSDQESLSVEDNNQEYLAALMFVQQYDKSAAGKLGTKSVCCFSQALGTCDKGVSCLYSHNKDVIHQYHRDMIEKIVKSKDFDPEKSLPSGVTLTGFLAAKPVGPQ